MGRSVRRLVQAIRWWWRGPYRFRVCWDMTLDEHGEEVPEWLR